MAAPWFDDLTLHLDEDFDDEEQFQGQGKLWNVDISSKNGEPLPTLNCKLLIVALGNSPHLFVERYLKAQCGGALDHLAHVRLSKNTEEYASWETATIKRTEATLWRSHDDVIVVGCRQEVLPEVATRWCEALLNVVQAEKTMVWSTFPGVRFQGMECLMDELPMLRCLATASWPHKLEWPVLESPNMVFGCSAAMLTQCQLLHIPSAVVSLVIGQADVDLEELAMWHRVLDTDACKEFFKPILSTPRQESMALLRKVIPPPSCRGSMFQ